MSPPHRILGTVSLWRSRSAAAWALGLTLLWLAPLPGMAAGPAGSPSDHLDAPGAPTDRYLDSSELLDVLHAANPRFYQCFRTHVRGGGEPGDVVVTFTVGAAGTTVQAEAEVASGFRLLGGCLEGVVMDVVLGEHDGDPVPASYPLVYQVDRKGARVVPYPTVFIRPGTLRLPLLTLPPDIGLGEVRMLERVLFGGADPSLEAVPETEEASGETSSSQQAIEP